MIVSKAEFERIVGANTVWVPEPTAFGMVRPGDRVEIGEIGENDDVLYKSKVVDIPNIGFKALSIFAPSTTGGAPFVMQPDVRYNIVVHAKDYLIRFICCFEGYIKEQKNYFVVIKILDEGIKLQRREFFRFTCMLAMKFSIMYTGDNEAAKLLQNSGYSAMHNGIIRDIGGGGIRFITNEDLETDGMIQCTIMLGTTAMLIKGKILDKQYMPKSNMKFQYRALFLDVSQSTQDEIVNFIFAEQRKQKKFRQAPPIV